MATARILVFPDAGPAIGGGHVMRCLTLARALHARGAEIAFAANPFGQAILVNFGARDMPAFPLSDDVDEAAPQAAAWASSWKADWALLDHYGLTPAQEAQFKGARRLAVLDDRADRPRPAQALLDASYGRGAGAYTDLLPAGAKVFVGPMAAPVRPEFAAHRRAALERRRQGGHLKHVLVSLGLTDVGGITERVVHLLRQLHPELVFDVVLGDAAPSLPALREAAKTDCAVRLHVDTHAMAELMVEADFAVGAGGSSVWERAVVGLPAVTVALADNQRPMAEAMAHDGLTLAVDASDAAFETALADAAARLIQEPSLRRAFSEKTAAACDGLGAERFAEALLS